MEPRLEPTASRAVSAAAQVGRRGEEVAAAYLLTQGYRINARNIRVGRDEIDLLAYDPQDGVLVFVEVKARTRRSVDYHPELAAGARKRARLRRAARSWVAANAYDGGYRIDLVCIVAGRVVRHLRELAWH